MCGISGTTSAPGCSKSASKSDSPDLYCAVVLALSTGARRMEILGLRWGQVDFARRAITVLETKNGEIRSLPLVGHAFDLMVERAKVRRIDTDLGVSGAQEGTGRLTFARPSRQPSSVPVSRTSAGTTYGTARHRISP